MLELESSSGMNHMFLSD